MKNILTVLLAIIFISMAGCASAPFTPMVTETPKTSYTEPATPIVTPPVPHTNPIIVTSKIPPGPSKNSPDTITTQSALSNDRPEKIAFVSNRDGNEEIYSMNIDGSNQIRLTNNDLKDNNPAWSPDGKIIAFEEQGKDGFNNIFVMDSDGDHQVQLTTQGGREPGWAPDGSRIVFVSERLPPGRSIFDMNPDGTNQICLAKAESWENDDPVWSPDGRTIAFTAQGCVQTVSTDGRSYGLITGIRERQSGQAAWSPDGTKITVNRNQQIWVMNADGIGAISLADSGEHPSWSSDGTKIVYCRAEQNTAAVIIMDANGENQKQITDSAFEIKNHSPVLWGSYKPAPASARIPFPTPSYGSGTTTVPSAPGSGKIAFVSNRDGNAELYVMNEDGTDQTRLTSTPDFDEGAPAWSPDGTRLAFTVEDIKERTNIWVMDWTGENTRQLTTQNVCFAPAWSPDGTKIVYRNSAVLYVMNADGNGKKQINNDVVSDQPDWSPDGTTIVFIVNDGDIATIDPVGTNKKVLNTKIDGQNGCPVWSPDGTKIAFVKSYHVSVMNSDGKGLLSGLTDYLGWDPSWSPDGKRIAYSFSPGQNKFTQIMVMDANGEHKLALTPENPGTVDHSPAWWGSKNKN